MPRLLPVHGSVGKLAGTFGPQSPLLQRPSFSIPLQCHTLIFEALLSEPSVRRTCSIVCDNETRAVSTSSFTVGDLIQIISSHSYFEKKRLAFHHVFFPHSNKGTDTFGINGIIGIQIGTEIITGSRISFHLHLYKTVAYT